MLRIYVLAEKPRSDPANERCSPFDGILPKRLIDGGIVNDADQIAQPLTILAKACRRNRFRGRSQMRRRIDSKNCFHSEKPSDGAPFIELSVPTSDPTGSASGRSCRSPGCERKHSPWDNRAPTREIRARRSRPPPSGSDPVSRSPRAQPKHFGIDARAVRQKCAGHLPAPLQDRTRNTSAADARAA